MQLLWFIILFHVSVTMFALIASAPTPTKITATTETSFTSMDGKLFMEFIKHVENLVLNTTEEALNVTTQVYRNVTKSMSPVLQHSVLPITAEYIRMVEETFKYPRNYTEQRRLLRLFRYNNRRIERLRQQLQPEYPKFEFLLISNDFYYFGKNVTEFDNLYLKFMVAFQSLTQTLWDTMPEEVVGQQQDLQEILNEISQEKELHEKDKLYDEFIEMFLFKTEVDAIENRQLG